MSALRKIDAKAARILPIGLVLAATLATPALGQGFGPDPFRPLTSQFDPYVTPMGPAGPGAGQSVGNSLGGRGPNQYQDYLNEIQGAGRQRSERYGIGLPYFRSSVDPNFGRNSDREYQPNRASQRTFEETQQLIADKYLAFMAEKDPKRRAELFRTYDKARRQSVRAMSARRQSPARIMDQARSGDSGAAAKTAVRDRSQPGALPREKKEASPALEGNLTRGRSIPPAPPLSRSTRGSTSRLSPSETRERARAALDRGSDRTTVPNPSRAARGSSRPAALPDN